MLNVGIIGLGTMGMTHLAAYEKLAAAGVEVRVLAAADKKFATGDTVGGAGNLAGQGAGGALLDSVEKHASPEALFDDPRVDAVDICAPTPAHKPLVLAAVAAGKHVLVEKPLALAAGDVGEMIRAARAARRMLMPAHCMRFWPGWDWLKDVCSKKVFGDLESVVFTRIGAQPASPFYHDSALSGGALFDLHIHDADFVVHLLGEPSAVVSQGFRAGGSGIVHAITRYEFGGASSPAAAPAGAPFVVAEGAWTREAENVPFVMRYRARFERATALYEFGTPPVLTLYEAGKPPVPVPLPADTSLGYEREIAEFIRCATAGVESRVVPAADALRAVRLLECEARSIAAGGAPVSLSPPPSPAPVPEPL
ncbi:MAG: Gfo/Idh/MocA family oxidoreductase [Puniceicoccales bacterium]|jgi:predicted dehydrogenase|nr:Gfo/Idh/MocA family oxidoreductase [Puniceicoccales bacterium]